MVKRVSRKGRKIKRKNIRRRTLKQKGGSIDGQCPSKLKDYDPVVDVSNINTFFDEDKEDRLVLGCLIKDPEQGLRSYVSKRKRRVLTLEKIKSPYDEIYSKYDSKIYNYFISYQTEEGIQKIIVLSGIENHVRYNNKLGKIIIIDERNGREFRFSVNETPLKNTTPNDKENKWIEIFKKIQERLLNKKDAEDNANETARGKMIMELSETNNMEDPKFTKYNLNKLYDLLVKGKDKELEHYSEVRKEIMDYSEEAQYKVEQAINKLNRIGSVATIIEEYEKSKKTLTKKDPKFIKKKLDKAIQSKCRAEIRKDVNDKFVEYKKQLETIQDITNINDSELKEIIIWAACNEEKAPELEQSYQKKTGKGSDQIRGDDIYEEQLIRNPESKEILGPSESDPFEGMVSPSSVGTDIGTAIGQSMQIPRDVPRPELSEQGRRQKAFIETFRSNIRKHTIKNDIEIKNLALKITNSIKKKRADYDKANHNNKENIDFFLNFVKHINDGYTNIEDLVHDYEEVGRRNIKLLPQDKKDYDLMFKLRSELMKAQKKLPTEEDFKKNPAEAIEKIRRLKILAETSKSSSSKDPSISAKPSKFYGDRVIRLDRRMQPHIRREVPFDDDIRHVNQHSAALRRQVRAPTSPLARGTSLEGGKRKRRTRRTRKTRKTRKTRRTRRKLGKKSKRRGRKSRKR